MGERTGEHNGNGHSEGQMVFRFRQQDTIVRSPEELAQQCIHVHPASIDKTWGPGAAERYFSAQRAMRESFPAQGSIPFQR